MEVKKIRRCKVDCFDYEAENTTDIGIAIRERLN
jgi:hypothetical protein